MTRQMADDEVLRRKKARENMRQVVEQSAAKSGSGALLLSACTVADLFADHAALQAERDALRKEVGEVREAYQARTRDWYSQGDAYDAALQRAERAESALEALRGQVEGLRQFASAMMERWPMGDVDGGDLQSEAVNAGLLREVVMTDFCGESCSCAEYATRAELPVTCYRRTTLLTGKPESDERIAALLAIKERMG